MKMAKREFFRLLAGMESAPAGGRWSRTLFLGLLPPLLLTLIFGRVFCSWICPAGFLFEMADKLRGLLSRRDQPVRNTRFWRGNKYVLLFSGAALAFIFGLPLLGSFYPPALMGREIHQVADSFFAGSKAGLSIFGAVSLSGLTLFLFIIVLAEIFVSRRMWCRYFCPGGALYSMLGKWRLIRIENKSSHCTLCGVCRAVCPMGLNPVRESPGMECDNCLACWSSCKPGSLKLRFGFRIFKKKGSKAAATSRGGE